jgi:hypothetical protein
MPARFRETSSRSARLEFGAGVNAELERGRALPLPRPAGNHSPGFGMRKAARESRMQTPRMAGTSQQRQGRCLSVPVWVHRERVLRRAGSAGMRTYRGRMDEEVGACRQQ